MTTNDCNARVRFMRFLIRVLLIAVLAVTNVHASDPALLRQAEDLINAGRHEDARRLLEPREAQFAGDPVYDYLLGLALLESGEPGRAALALERAVAQDQRFAGARLDLARAYYAGGDYAGAQREFQTLRDQNPPPAARETIEEYLALIANRQRRLRFEYRLGGRVGYDSNANSATAANEFLGFDLIEQSRETSSPFAEFGAGAVVLKPLSQRLLLDTRLNLRRRNNPDASFVNATAGNASVGLRHVSEGSSRSVQLQYYRVDIDGELNSKGLALAANWEFAVARQTRLGIFGRVGQTRFGTALRVKDVNQLLLGTSANYSFAAGNRGTLGAALLLGTDDPRMSGSRYARDLYGLRLSAGWAFSPQIRAQFTAALMQSDYDQVFFEQRYDSPREDTLSSAAVKLQWRLSPRWLLSHEVAYTNNDTDVDVFAFERVETSLSFDRLWR